jgi:hypothetical protein
MADKEKGGQDGLGKMEELKAGVQSKNDVFHIVNRVRNL